MNRNLCCQLNFSFVFVWHRHPWRHCLPSVAHRDDQQSLGIKKGFCCNPVNDWILADILHSILPNRLWDAKCSRWQLQSHGYPFSSKWPFEAWKDCLNCALTSQLHIFFTAMKDLFMLWSLSFTHDNWVRQMHGIVRIKLIEIMTQDHKSGPACMKYLCRWCQISLGNPYVNM